MPNRRATRHIVLHCSATRPSQDVDAETIRTWHLAKGWKDIGYHFVLGRDGTVETGRAVDAVGSHVAGHNSTTLGICLVGGLNEQTGKPEDNFTRAQWAALRTLVAELVGKYPGATLLGHRDLSPDKDGDGIVEKHEWLKECPCFDVRSWARRNGFPPAPGESEGETPVAAAPPAIVVLPPAAAAIAPVSAPAASPAADIDVARLELELAAAPADAAAAEGYSLEREGAQKALKRMGVHEVGLCDGKPGTRFTAGLAAFQRARGLAVTGELDERTKAEIDTATAEGWSLPIAPERAQGLPENSRIIAGASKQTGAGIFATILGFCAMVGEKISAAFEPIRDVVEIARPFIAPVATFVAEHWQVVLMAGGGFVIWQGLKIVRARVDDHRQGKTT